MTIEELKQAEHTFQWGYESAYAILVDMIACGAHPDKIESQRQRVARLARIWSDISAEKIITQSEAVAE